MGTLPYPKTLCYEFIAAAALPCAGDLNIAPAPLDHCDPGPAAEFARRADRAWLGRLLRGPFRDMFRAFHPDRHALEQFFIYQVHSIPIHYCVKTILLDWCMMVRYMVCLAAGRKNFWLQIVKQHFYACPCLPRKCRHALHQFDVCSYSPSMSRIHLC